MRPLVHHQLHRPAPPAPWKNGIDGETANNATKTTERWCTSSWVAPLVVSFAPRTAQCQATRPVGLVVPEQYRVSNDVPISSRVRQIAPRTQRRGVVWVVEKSL